MREGVDTTGDCQDDVGERGLSLRLGDRNAIPANMFADRFQIIVNGYGIDQ